MKQFLTAMALMAGLHHEYSASHWPDQTHISSKTRRRNGAVQAFGEARYIFAAQYDRILRLGVAFQIDFLDRKIFLVKEKIE